MIAHENDPRPHAGRRPIFFAPSRGGRIMTHRRHARRLVSLRPAMHLDITDDLANALRESLTRAGLPVPESVVWDVPREERHGDYATNAALALARPARKAPRAVAEAIVANFPKTAAVE